MKKLTFIILISFISLSIVSCSEEETQKSSEYSTSSTTTSSTTTLSAPTGLTATSGDTKVTLSWTVVSGASSYTVYWGTATGITSSSTTISSISTNTYSHTGLTNGTTYYYKVAAVDSAGTGTLSSEVNAAPTATSSGSTSTLSAPTGLSATGAAGQVTLDWTALSGASSYNVYWDNASPITSSDSAITSISTDNYTHSGLDNGTTYYYKVAGVNSAGTGTLSSEVSASTPLPAPDNLTATAGFKQVALDWDNVTGATSYTVYWDNATGVSSSSTAITSVSDDNYTHTSLTGGATYYYKVGAVNSSGTGTLSSEVNATAGSSQLLGGSMQGTDLSLSGTVTTFAGTAGTSGDTDGTGTSALFHAPRGITTDGTNLYVTNYDKHTIRKIVISSGVVTTLAGTSGTSGTTDGTGTAAKFNFPAGITTDGTNLYVADGSHTIRKIVISSGEVTTLAGTVGTSGFIDATGTAARFNYPAGITTDGTNLYVTETSNHIIRKIVISTGVVSIFAGTVNNSGTTDATATAAKFNVPIGITTDGTNLYVADASNHTIRKIVISSVVVTTLAGTAGTSGSTDGTGTAAKFNGNAGIITDGTNLYVTDRGNHTIRKIVISSGVVTTLAGSAGNTGTTDGTGSVARFYYPRHVTTDGTSLYIADENNNTIRKVD